MERRKGARTVKSVDSAVLKRLNQGTLETASLVEGLAMDLGELARAVKITEEACPEAGIVKRMAFYGSKMKGWRSFQAHPSDTVRGFACYALAADAGLDFSSKVDAMALFADDPHFGVREWAWLALREEIRANLPLALKLLQKWTLSEREGLRRFASEATRPRGVWCAHIEELKAFPEKALPLLNRLKQDPSKYVQNSVGNWLNDAGKSKPKWVKQVAKEWLRTPHPHTAAIVKRGLRSFV
jgi:3-methyladenine DNA glycosylase AlkC